MNPAEIIITQYRLGQRYFSELELEGGIFDDQNLQDIIFENCFLYSSFRRANLQHAKFINGNIKSCDFREANLTKAHFENVSVEGALFAGAITDGIYFNNNFAFSKVLTQTDFDEWLKNIDENEALPPS
jgi:uncharacterized protein YjbI with pentapeptide repeats